MENYTFILGYLTTKMFLAMCLFSILGIVMSLLIDSLQRNKESLNTPRKFDFWFLIKDNWKAILLTVLAVLVSIRFSSSLFPGQFIGEEAGTPDGIEKWLFGSLGIGLGYNQLVQTLKKKTSFLQVKRS